MIETKDLASVALSHTQATELSLLVDMEARWENMRKFPGTEAGVAANSRDLQGRQKAYEAFRAKLSDYNRRFKPGHVSELLLNTPARLAIWCRKMADLYRQLERDALGQCPAHLLEKAYRWADQVSVRLNREPLRRTTAPRTLRGTIAELEALADWCMDQAAAPGSNPASALQATAVPA